MTASLLGFGYLIDGFRLIAQPRIRRYVVIPIIINCLVFLAGFFCLEYFVAEFNQWFTAHLPHWLAWLHYFIWLIFFAGFFLFFIYAFATIANIISAPFNSFLSQHIAEELTGMPVPTTTLWQDVQDIPRVMSRQFSILGFYLPRAILILFLFLFPVVQTIAPFVWFLFNAYFLTLTYLDYPTDTQRVPLPAVQDWLQSRRVGLLGFGSGVLLCAMIPVVNIFVIPAAVAGATKLWIEENRLPKLEKHHAQR